MVTTVLIFVVVMAITAGLIWVTMRMERSYRQRRVGRHSQAWRAGGASGLPPGSYFAADYSDGCRGGGYSGDCSDNGSDGGGSCNDGGCGGGGD